MTPQELWGLWCADVCHFLFKLTHNAESCTLIHWCLHKSTTPVSSGHRQTDQIPVFVKNEKSWNLNALAGIILQWDYLDFSYTFFFCQRLKDGLEKRFQIQILLTLCFLKKSINESGGTFERFITNHLQIHQVRKYLVFLPYIILHYVTMVKHN